ncbi:MAG: peptidase M48 [Acidobacteria bacterium RIFCSPLOWO2_12_FULL_54_10]|nr:MAG: peptidase M48 [Acidobacteria bacterium RIFCSPLOWO2_12_FULL_54_10]
MTAIWRKKSSLLFLAALLVFQIPVFAAQDDKDDDEKKKGSKDDVEAIGDRDVGKGMNFYSLEKEIALGKALAQQVEQQSQIVMDPVVAEYVNRVGQNLVRNSDAQVPFSIKVIDSDEINAFALPGGFFFVNTGLILATESEAELAGVMAHEIAHVAARHGTRSASKAELANWLTIPLIFLGGPIGFGARSAASVLVPLKFLQFSRGAEREADFLGLQYLYKTGYDPYAFTDFFEKIQAREKSRPGTLAKAFSTHPLTPDRIDAAQTEMTTILPPRDEYVVSSSEYDRVVDRLRVLQNRGMVDGATEDKEDRPTLRRTTKAPDDGSTPSSDKTEETEEDKDAKPRLERR